MTITNHVRMIQDNAERLIGHVDDRDYPMAHTALDNIEANVRSARDHVDQLQLKADCAARPAGENVT